MTNHEATSIKFLENVHELSARAIDLEDILELAKAELASLSLPEEAAFYNNELLEVIKTQRLLIAMLVNQSMDTTDRLVALVNKVESKI